MNVCAFFQVILAEYMTIKQGILIRHYMCKV